MLILSQFTCCIWIIVGRKEIVKKATGVLFMLDAIPKHILTNFCLYGNMDEVNPDHITVYSFK